MHEVEVAGFKNYKILVADDHFHFRKGVAYTLSCLGMDSRNVYEAVNGKQAVELAASINFDVILMDINMPVMNGLEASGDILRKRSISKIIVITMYEEETLVRNLLAIGVLGIVSKNIDDEVLRSAIEAVMNGEYFLNHKRTPQFPAPELSPSPYLSLTERERKLVNMLQQGQSNRQIASEQGISIRSVESIRYRLLKKIGVRNTNELLRYALKSGLIPLN